MDVVVEMGWKTISRMVFCRKANRRLLVWECDERDFWNGRGISIAVANRRQALARSGVRNAAVGFRSGAKDGRRSELERLELE